jgi:hypothetical protein
MHLKRKRPFSAARKLSGFLVAVIIPLNVETGLNAQPNVLTAHYGNTRQGYHGQESVLTSSTVSSAIHFAAFSPLLVDLEQPGGNINAIYAQPCGFRSIAASTIARPRAICCW